MRLRARVVMGTTTRRVAQDGGGALLWRPSCRKLMMWIERAVYGGHQCEAEFACDLDVNTGRAHDLETCTSC